MNNNPDPSGHFAIPVAIIVAAVVVAKVIDYGWTAYDAWQSTQTLNDPTATDADKALAAANLAMTATFEAAEPDDALPIGLPLDDLARRGILKLGDEAVEHSDEFGDGISAFLRAGDRSHTNPNIYKLRDSDAGSGLSTFDGSQVSSADILSTLKSNDRVVEIPANGVPDGLEFIQTQGTTGNPLLDQHHWELRDSTRFNEMPWSQYKSWWNDTIAPKLAELAKGWKVFK